MADWKTPDNAKYTENDEWIIVDGDTAKIGLTDYAQDQLSDIVFVDMQVEVGDTVSAGDSFATVESVKAASDVYAPASGEVVAVNAALDGRGRPSLLDDVRHLVRHQVGVLGALPRPEPDVLAVRERLGM